MIQVRIGISQVAKEIDIEISSEADRDALIKEIEDSIEKSEGVLWLTDRKGTSFGIPTSKVAYIEVTSGSEDRRVGFGAI